MATNNGLVQFDIVPTVVLALVTENHNTSAYTVKVCQRMLNLCEPQHLMADTGYGPAIKYWLNRPFNRKLRFFC